MKYDDIETAFEYANFGGCEEHSAIIDRETGEIYYSSDSMITGEEEELPEDLYDGDDKYVWLPEKNDLDLGKELVMEFAYQHIPDEVDHVHAIFHRRGAYSRFKDFLDERGQLQAWYDFENTHTKSALIQWCRDNGLELEED